MTGLGVVCPIGLSTEEFWASCLAGRTGTRRIDADWFDPERFATHVGAPVRGFELQAHGFGARDGKTLDPACWFALAATKEAVESAGFDLVETAGKHPTFRLEGVDRDRVATSIGTGIGGLTSFETVHRRWVEHGHFAGTGWMKLGLPMLIPNAPTGNTAIRFGFRGECRAAPTACAAGTMSIGDAFRLIRDGEADMAVAGGTERVLSDLDGLGLVGFEVLHVMSTRNDDPEHASRPFDSGRDGFVLGEGAGILVLESESHVRARGGPMLAELRSYACTCDASSMMAPDPSGEMVVRAMRRALELADLPPRDVGHVNAHATATVAGDRVEAAALREVFGDGSNAPLVSATKSLTGHCIGASGAIEAAATVLAVSRGVVHQTQNLEVVGEGCELNHVRGAPMETRIDAALSCSYAFGGHDAVLVFCRP